MLTKHRWRTTTSFHIQHLKVRDIAKLLWNCKYWDFQEAVSEKVLFSVGISYWCFRTGVCAPLPAWHGPVLLHSLLEGKGLFSGHFLKWQIWWFLRINAMYVPRVGGGRYWENLGNWSSLLSVMLSSFLLGQELEHPYLKSGGGCHPEEQCYSNPRGTVSLVLWDTALLQKGQHRFEHGNLTFPSFTEIYERPKQERSWIFLLDLRERVVNTQQL